MLTRTRVYLACLSGFLLFIPAVSRAVEIGGEEAAALESVGEVPTLSGIDLTPSAWTNTQTPLADGRYVLKNSDLGPMLSPLVPAVAGLSREAHAQFADRVGEVFGAKGLEFHTFAVDGHILAVGKAPIASGEHAGKHLAVGVSEGVVSDRHLTQEGLREAGIIRLASEGKNESAAAAAKRVWDGAPNIGAETAVAAGESATEGFLPIDSPERTAPFKERFVFVKGGKFTRGSPEADQERFSNEDQREVEVQPFYIAKWQTTQAEFLEKMGRNPSHFTEDDGDGDHRDGYNAHHPVENVSVYDAMEYANKRSDDEGYEHAYKLENIKRYSRGSLKGSIKSAKVTLIASNGYRLPTEDEWEYAAREAGQATGPRPFDVEELDEHTWNIGNSGSRTHAVGRRKANRLGLRDMLGNVWEWTQSIYSGSFRVVRGGSWSLVAGILRPAIRYFDVPGSRYSYLGFRLVRSAVGP